VFYVISRTWDTPVGEQSVNLTAPAVPQPQSTWAPVQTVVLTRVSLGHYKTDDGLLIVTTQCAESALNITGTLEYDFQPDASNHKLTFPSGRFCAVDFVMR